MLCDILSLLQYCLLCGAGGDLLRRFTELVKLDSFSFRQARMGFTAAVEADFPDLGANMLQTRGLYDDVRSSP